MYYPDLGRYRVVDVFEIHNDGSKGRETHSRNEYSGFEIDIVQGIDIEVKKLDFPETPGNGKAMVHLRDREQISLAAEIQNRLARASI